nr:Nif3-like dinuclear metal center hexameric protein [Zhaonella formicivorans]
MTTLVNDVLEALNHITGGRVVTSMDQVAAASHPFVVMKSSNIPGKSVMEFPGLVFGNPQAQVKKLAVTMTLTESAIELAGATGVDVIIAHHPIADAANSGGVPLKYYLSLYNIAVIELHEAFHGLHPGIPYLHGHRTLHVDIAYAGLPGNILFVGQALEEIKTAGDIVSRLNLLMDKATEEKMLEREKELRDSWAMEETVVATGPKILNGSPDSPVKNILHIFPHTGFSPAHLEKAVGEFPEVDTVLASISRVRPDSALVAKAKELGLNFIVGNSHAVEIFENGLPLAAAVQMLLPEVEVVLFRERVTAIPVAQAGNPNIKRYAAEIATKYLVEKTS